MDVTPVKNKNHIQTKSNTSLESSFKVSIIKSSHFPQRKIVHPTYQARKTYLQCTLIRSIIKLCNTATSILPLEFNISLKYSCIYKCINIVTLIFIKV